MRWELERVPELLHRVGATPVVGSPSQIREHHLRSLKLNLPWASATFRLHFAALRPFLRRARNPVAETRALWSVPSGDAGRRRWLTKELLADLFRSARGTEKLLVALEGFNGLRRVEVLRLRARDVHSGEGFLDVRGKGRFGGKWRQVPISSIVLPILLRSREGLPPEALLVPLSSSGADLLLQRAVARSGCPRRGVRVSHHDLRRTFGRLAHEAGMDLVQLKNLFGHSSIDQTVHYIGLDQVEMRRGLDQLNVLLSPLLRPEGRGSARLPRDR